MSDSKLSEFVQVTHASLEDAHRFSDRAHGDLPLAVSMYLAESAPPSQASSAVASPAASAPASQTPSRAMSRTGSAATSTTSMHQAPRRRFATFSDLAAQERDAQPAGARSSSHGGGDDPHSSFTGGEKSGLAVTPQQRPPNLVDEIIRRAQQNVARPGAGAGDSSDDSDLSDSETAAARRTAAGRKTSSFTGRGSRLGSESDPPAARAAPADNNNYNNYNYNDDDDDGDDDDDEVQQRTSNFWTDGFSVDDGASFRFDDPANEAYSRAINAGRAPMRSSNVRPRQPVDVKVVQHHRAYVKPAATSQNSGPGQRLGSPSPSDQYHLGSAAQSSGGAARSNRGKSGKSEGKSEGNLAGSSVDNAAGSSAAAATCSGAEGDAAVQIRFADGSTQRSRFDRAAPVQQLYDYIDAVQPAGRGYVSQSPMPPTKSENKQQSSESAGAVGAVVVQRWT